MEHRQSEHECGRCMVLLRHLFGRDVRDVYNNTYHDRWIGRGGPLQELNAHQI
jgi:hypothetical protein